MNKKKLFLGFIDRDRPSTWITTIIVLMLTIPLVVTMTLFLLMK